MKKNLLLSVTVLLVLSMTSCQFIPTLNDSLQGSIDPSAQPTIDINPTIDPSAQPTIDINSTIEPTVEPTVTATPVIPSQEIYYITVWISEMQSVQLLERQIDAFEALHPDVVINATVENHPHYDIAMMMKNDVDSGADIFCFAQDQLAGLVQTGALNKLGAEAFDIVKASNDAGSVRAATFNDNLYCYPLTSDNGYFMYYDKSVIQESSLDSLEAIIADCEAAEKLFSFECETSAWYNASWFFATGCVSEWTTDNEGKFLSVNDTFNSEAGVTALKGMQKLLKSPCYISSSNGYDFAAAIPSAVVVSGTWSANEVKEFLGDNFGATDLPSFNVDGKDYHLGSFSGNKLMGVKPQSDAKRTKVLNDLALYLTSKDCQYENFMEMNLIPSNLEVQNSDDVLKNEAIVALLKQSNYAVPQGQIHGSWWDIAKYPALIAKEAETDEELYDALIQYEQRINELFNFGD